MARDLRAALADYGIKAFVAHEDINPSEDWQDRILEELAGSAVFIALVTKNFKDSKWTDQESGIAFSRKALIIPVRVEMNPYGFLGRYQAIRFRGSVTTSFVLEVIGTILKDAQLGPSTRYWLIHEFGKANTFEEATLAASRLQNLGPYSREELKMILKLACDNYQIYHSFRARRFIDQLLSKARGANRPGGRSIGKWRQLKP